LPSGTYKIRIKDQAGCISDFNSVELNGFFIPAPEFSTIQPSCNFAGSITITTTASEYSFDDGVTWQTSNILDKLTPGDYIIKIKNAAGCISNSASVKLTNSDIVNPELNITQPICDLKGSITIKTPAAEYSFDNGITWQTSNILENLTNGNYLIKIKNGQNCISEPVKVNIIPFNNRLLNAKNFEVTFCDDLNDGNEIVNLTNYNTNIISDISNFTFSFYNSLPGATNQTSSDAISNPSNYKLELDQKTFFVRITSGEGCIKIVELKLILQTKPILNISDIVTFCENTNINIYGDLGYDDYTWSTGEKTTSITVSNPGDYFLTVVKKYGTLECSTTKNFKVVKSNAAKISKISTNDWTINDNSIVVLVTNNSVGNYEYSLDGIDYQDSNSFSGLETGEYKVYIRDKNGCGVIDETTYLLMYPKFFTPNGDGFNDTWKIKSSVNEPNLKIKIFDRFGKILKELNNNSEGWDGLFNGQKLQASDYWFILTRADGKEYKGHFAIKR
jgi:gliding motility-associated-like protein